MKKENTLLYFFCLLSFLTKAQTEPIYDNIHRLDSLISENATIAFDYDPVGNRISKTVSLDGVLVHAKTFIQSIYNESTGLMSDGLRNQDLLPASEPYSNLGYTHTGGGEEESYPVVFKTADNNAIVDWLVVEIRDSVDPEIILATQSVLLQKDGDLVAKDGVGSIHFPTISPGWYNVAIQHRNHLGVMTYQPVYLSGDIWTTYIDFTDPSTATYGTNAQKNINGTMVMWGGDANWDGKIIYSGADTDVNTISYDVLNNPLNPSGLPFVPFLGYHTSDITMDGKTVYSGADTDVNLISANVLNHPGNPVGFPFFIIQEQMP